MRCMYETGSHYYNLINNEIIDFTKSQFKQIPDYKNGEERSKKYLFSNEDTKNRYKLLLGLVRQNFIKYSNQEYNLYKNEIWMKLQSL